MDRRLSQKYRLGGRIGGGGMAEVLRATAVGAEGFACPVAVKRIRPQLSSDPKFGEMFINEAHIASLLHHPNIAAVTDFDRDADGTYYLVMELIDGIDLRTLRGSGAIPFDVITYLIGEVLKGLAYAHELVHKGQHLGIVHRDVSPHNVMIGWDGSVKLVDFGIAKAVAASQSLVVSYQSQEGSLKGKVAYMSPEQAHGKRLDGRSDVFAVGVMLHELLTGRRLFTGATEPEVLARMLHQPIAPPNLARPEVPADLSAVALRMLERDKRRRYRNARAALEALLSCTSASARGGLALQDVLRQRFPDRVPRIPTAVSSPHSVVDIMPETATAQRPVRQPVGRTLTDPGSSGTPSAVGQRDTATRTRTGRSHSALWIAGGAGFMVAAGVILFAALSGGGSSPRAAPPLVAGDPPPAISIDAAPAAAPPVRTAPVDVSPASPDAAPPARRSSPPATHHQRVTRPPADRSEPGRLRITVDPWAMVVIDGKPRGITPFKGKLPPGDHRIELRNDELSRAETIHLVIESGLPKRLDRHWK